MELANGLGKIVDVSFSLRWAQSENVRLSPSLSPRHSTTRHATCSTISPQASINSREPRPHNSREPRPTRPPAAGRPPPPAIRSLNARAKGAHRDKKVTKWLFSLRRIFTRQGCIFRFISLFLFTRERCIVCAPGFLNPLSEYPCLPT